MAQESIRDFWRGVPKVEETAFGTDTTTGFDKMYPQAGDLIQIEDVAESNESELTGTLEPTSRDRISLMGKGSHSQRLLPQHIRFIALALGACTDSDLTGAYSHAVTPLESDVSLPSMTIIENHGALEQYGYTGVCVNSFTISSAQNAFVQFACEFITRGERTTPAIAEPSAIAESYLLYNDVEYNVGGTISDTISVTGGTDFEGTLLDFSYSYNNNATMIYPHGASDQFASECLKGTPSQTLSTKLFMRDVTDLSRFDTDANITLRLALQGSQIGATAYNFGFILMFPRVKITNAETTEHEGQKAVSVDYQILNPDSDTYSSVHITGYDEQSDYL